MGQVDHGIIHGQGTTFHNMTRGIKQNLGPPKVSIAPQGSCFFRFCLLPKSWVLSGSCVFLLTSKQQKQRLRGKNLVESKAFANSFKAKTNWNRYLKVIFTIVESPTP